MNSDKISSDAMLVAYTPEFSQAVTAMSCGAYSLAAQFSRQAYEAIANKSEREKARLHCHRLFWQYGPLCLANPRWWKYAKMCL